MRNCPRIIRVVLHQSLRAFVRVRQKKLELRQKIGEGTDRGGSSVTTEAKMRDVATSQGVPTTTKNWKEKRGFSPGDSNRSVVLPTW